MPLHNSDNIYIKVNSVPNIKGYPLKYYEYEESIYECVECKCRVKPIWHPSSNDTLYIDWNEPR